jgi:hypothetical protein
MALIRCPRHGIPYNEDNPRGCPACALEKEGGEQAQVMRELARASQVVKRPSGPNAAPLAEPVYTVPVTTPPRPPVTEPGMLERLQETARRRPIATIGVPLSLILLGFLLLRPSPKFIQQPSPAPYHGDVLPLPIEPGVPLSAVFAILGVQPPRPSPEGPSLERYSYGTDLNIDALNGAVYAISLLVPNRSWRGLRVGIPQQEVEGALALLGPPQPAAPPVDARADILRGLLVYPSLDARPTRSFKAEVRPPNGCYDVLVTIQPRAVGILVSGQRRYAVLGPPKTQPDWVATRVQVINRAVPGPLGPAACEA